MKVVVHNKDNLSEKDINNKVYRSRGVILNSKNEVLLGYCDGTYQFPGGYLEENETIVQGLIREIKEETGITIDKVAAPFYVIQYYNKDWPKENVNTYTEMNYFFIKTDEQYNLNQTNFDEFEKEHGFTLRYVPLDDVEKFLETTISFNEKNQLVYKEIIEVLRMLKSTKIGMETIIYNKDNLQESDITTVQSKVKVLLINSKREILLGYSHHEYQFPGGTKEDNEELIDTLNREIEEETGILLHLKKIDAFAKSIGYYKDWPEIGKNKKLEISYYEIITDELPNPNHFHLTEKEKAGNFELKYIALDKVEDELKEKVKKFGDDRGITKEMLNILKIYKG